MRRLVAIALASLASLAAGGATIAARTAMRAGNPLPYLRRVAYLSSNEGQLIDTGIGFKHTIKIVADCKFNAITSSTQVLFGFGASQGFWFGCSVYGNYSIGGVGDFGSCEQRQIVTAEYLNNEISVHVDGVTASRSWSLANARHLSLFQAQSATGTAYSSRASIYSFEVYDESATVLSLIPVLDFSGRPCMYNQAPSPVAPDDPSRFFYNQGTGEFTWGELEAAE